MKPTGLDIVRVRSQIAFPPELAFSIEYTRFNSDTGSGY